MFVVFSSLFGVGVSAVIESFLGGGVITLHRRLLSEIIEGPKEAAAECASRLIVRIDFAGVFPGVSLA
jgi:hypothetical protein